MQRLPIAAMLATILFIGTVAGAQARAFVQDEASLFGASAIDAATAKIHQAYINTHQVVFVHTVESLNGSPLTSAAHEDYQAVGRPAIEIFIAKNERRDIVMTAPSVTQKVGYSPSATIRTDLERNLRTGDYDAALTQAVQDATGVLLQSQTNTSHAGSDTTATYAGTTATAQTPVGTLQPEHHNGSGWLVLALVLAALGGIGFAVRKALRPKTFARYSDSNIEPTSAKSSTGTDPANARTPAPPPSTSYAAPSSPPPSPTVAPNTAAPAPPAAPTYVPAPSVTVVHDDSGSGMLTGLVLGEMMSNNAQRETTIVNNYEAPAAPAAPSASDDSTGNWNNSDTSDSTGSWGNSDTTDSSGGFSPSSDSSGSWGGSDSSGGFGSGDSSGGFGSGGDSGGGW